jgi:hypothetical protein
MNPGVLPTITHNVHVAVPFALGGALVGDGAYVLGHLGLQSSWSTCSAISLRKEGSSSRICCTISSSALRLWWAIFSSSRVDFRHQPAWRTMALISSG